MGSRGITTVEQIRRQHSMHPVSAIRTCYFCYKTLKRAGAPPEYWPALVRHVTVGGHRGLWESLCHLSTLEALRYEQLRYDRLLHEQSSASSFQNFT